MLILAYLGGSVQNFTQLGGRSVFLHPFIWSRVFVLIQFRDGSRVCIKFGANLGRSVIETLAMIRQAFGEENMSRTLPYSPGNY
jgi:hypothetical protein